MLTTALGFLFFWVIATFLAISVTGDHPRVALGIGVAGGLGLGVYIWRQVSQRAIPPAIFPEPSNFASQAYRYEIILIGPSLLILLFANRLPFFALFLALIWLILVGIGRKVFIGYAVPMTPLNLPVLLLSIIVLISLYAGIDLRQSGNAVCMLVGAMGFGYGVVSGVDTERRINLVFSLFLAVGAGIALSSFLVMQLPDVKLPLISALYKYFPVMFPRRIHPNYLGGMLVFFLPLSLWCFVFRNGSRTWTGATTGLIGVGLLMTQSRGSLLATVAALLLTGAYWNRRVWWLLLLLTVVGSIGAQALGIETILKFLARSEQIQQLASREELWQRAVYIIQDFPFTGIGFRSFPEVVDHLYPLFLAGPNIQMPHSHNFVLDVAVALGFPGFVAFGALLGAWGGMGWEIVMRSRGNPDKRACEIHVVGLIGGMLSFLIYSITDSIPLGEKAGVIFWGVLGLTVVLWLRVRAENS
jgi:O-antigen ligase